MEYRLSRNESAIGQEGLNLLKSKTVVVLGAGGVGSFAAKALARINIGHVVFVDKDDVDITGVNRQIYALTSTIDQDKVTLMEERIKLINPDRKVTSLRMFYAEETYKDIFNNYDIDYFIDASDTIIHKVHLMKECLERGIELISSMGVVNKTDPTRFETADISKIHTDPMAKVIRNRLKRLGIREGAKVIFSDESPIAIREDVKEIVGDKNTVSRKGQMPPFSNALVLSVVGLVCASYVVDDILKDISVRRIKDEE